MTSTPPPHVPRRGTRRGDARVRRILDGLPVPVVSLVVGLAPGDPARVAFLNPAAEELFGRRIADVAHDARGLWGHVHADDAAALRSWLAAPTERPLVRVVRFVTREGRVRPYELVATPRVDEDLLEAVAIDVVLHDASDRQDLEQAVAEGDAQLRAVVAGSREVVFHLRLRPTLSVAWTSDAAPALLGITSAELTRDASALFRTVVPEHRDRVEAAVRAASEAPTAVCFDVRRHGERVTIEMDLRPVRSHGQAAVVAVGRRIAAAVPTTGPETPEGPPAGARPERVDVASLAGAAMAAADLAHHVVELRTEHAPLLADRACLDAALQALAANLARHTPPGTRARVFVARATDGVLVSVADDGPGYAWPAGHASRDRGIVDLADPALAAGRGFAAVVAAAVRHGGRAALQSLPVGGTTVRLLLHDAVPVVAAPPAAAAAQDRSREPGPLLLEVDA